MTALLQFSGTFGALFMLVPMHIAWPLTPPLAPQLPPLPASQPPSPQRSHPTDSPPVDNALRVYVVNAGDKPVALAQVTVARDAQHTVGRTDSAGLFRTEHIAEGDWQATVRSVGYREALVSLHVARGDNAYTITVDPTQAVLSDVNVVEARRVSIRIAGFERRKAYGEPSGVITREQLERRNPAALSQMFRALPGIRLVEYNGAKVVVAARGSVPGLEQIIDLCPMRIAVDGMLRPPLANLDDTVPSDVYGVEVYYGPASLPQELATFRSDKWCGLVAIWTRDR